MEHHRGELGGHPQPVGLDRFHSHRSRVRGGEADRVSARRGGDVLPADRRRVGSEEELPRSLKAVRDDLYVRFEPSEAGERATSQMRTSMAILRSSSH
jgi:hypothetical protein